MRKLREFAEGEQLEALAQELEREVDRLMFLPDEADVKRRAREIYVRNVALNELLPPGKRLRSLDPTDVLRQWRAMYRLRQPGS